MRHQVGVHVFTHGQPLRVIFLAMGEQRIHGVVPRQDEAGKVGEKLAAQVEDDEEKVESAEADDTVGLRDTGSPLEVLENGVLGQLSRHHHG